MRRSRNWISSAGSGRSSDEDRYQQLAAAYLAAVEEKRKDGEAEVSAGGVTDPCGRRAASPMRSATG